MGDQSNKQIERVKKVVKKAIITALKPIIIMMLIVCIIVALICSVMYVVTLDTAILKDGSWDNVPYASDQYSSSYSIDEDGIASTTMSAQEVWDKLIENKSNINEYLKNASSLKKLLNAEMVSNLLDTRENPDAPIDWDSINEDTESKDVQGIIKLKRADVEGNKTTLVYMEPETFQSYIDEYNETGSETAKQQALSHFTLEKGYAASSFGNGEIITAGTSVELPAGLGSQFTYMDWQAITDPSSNQWKLKQQAGMNFDEEGFGRINGRYVIACTSTYGQVGDYVDFYQEDGSVIQCIIGDIKSQSDTGCNEWGHNNGLNVVEFVVDRDSWYTVDANGKKHGNHANPGNKGLHEEWKQNITKVVNGGSYFDNPNFGNQTITGNGTTVGSTTTGTTVGATTGITDSSSGGTTISGELMKWPTDRKDITSYFGVRNDPTNTSVKENHGAIDISVPTGSNVYATEAGTVIIARYSETAGNYVAIDHGNGYITKYMHNSSLLVKKGDKVTKGQVIALSGSTGKSTGPHCHFQIEYNGVKVDPLTFKYDNGMGNGTSGFGSNPDGTSTTSKYYAKVATWTETLDKQVSDDEDEPNYEIHTYNMTTTRINYEEFVSGYTMPFEYLWAFLTIGQEEAFVSDLADLVYGSEIEITVHDNLVVHTTVSTLTYTKLYKTVTSNVNVNVTYWDDYSETEIIDGMPYTRTWRETGGASETGGPFESVTSKPCKVVHTVITKTNTLEIKLTKANVWICEYTQDFTYQVPKPEEKRYSVPQLDEPYPDSPYATDNKDSAGLGENFRASVEAQYSGAHTGASATLSGVTSEYYKAKEGKSMMVYEKIEKYLYVSSPAKVREKVEKTGDENNFVKIYTSKDHAQNASNIYSATDWLFQLLSQNSSTANMVDITKYLLYKATEYDYGVVGYNFDLYKPENFKKIYEGYTSIEGVPGKVFNFLLSKGVPAAGAAAVLGNIQEESNFDPTAVNSSGCAGLCQWKDSRLTGLKNWAKSKQVDWTDVDTQLEYMWSELESSYPSVKNKIMGAISEKDIEYATWYWGRYYEVFFLGTNFNKTKYNTTQRYEYALQWYNQYNGANGN